MDEALIPILHAESPKTAYQVERAGSSYMNASKNQLGLFMGVYVPCILSIFSVILFLRLGWVVGEAGFFGYLGISLSGFFVTFCTILSISAISTNGLMKGGGAYYMISRALGPEFGGSIGLLFYIANVFAGTLYLAGFAESFAHTLGLQLWGSPTLTALLISSVALFFLTVVCYVGAELFAKTSFLIFVYVWLTIILGLISMFFRDPMPEGGYTGFNMQTLADNLGGRYTEGYSMWAVFAIFFPACTGIMAGANMSGDLANPGKAIPRGTLLAFGSTSVIYLVFGLVMAGSTRREALINDDFIIQTVSYSRTVVASGTWMVLIAAALAVLIGASRVMQALARDNLLPGLGYFKKGTKKRQTQGDEPRRAVILTWAICQASLFIGDINAIAPIDSMFFLLSYAIVNLACFVLKISGAPNFRPVWKYFSWHTALVGAVCSGIIMFISNSLWASVSIVLLVIVWFYIYFRGPETKWGDISQALIFHQVRKYLLRLDTRKEHVKFWRPSLLLLVSRAESSLPMITFANNLKKGGLYVIGSVLVGDVEIAGEACKTDQRAFLNLVSELRLKAFPEVLMAENVRVGVSNLLLVAGLGGMKPNTLCLGLFQGSTGRRDSTAEVRASSYLPPRRVDRIGDHSPSALNEFSSFDERIHGGPRSIEEYVSIIRDAAFFEKNILLTRNFEKLDRGAIADFRRRSSKGMFAGKNMTIDVWMWPQQDYEGYRSFEATVSMALLFANILHTSGRHDKDVWAKHTTIRMLSLTVHPDQRPDDELQKLDKYVHEARIQAEVQVVKIDSFYTNGISRAFGDLSPEDKTEAIAEHIRRHSDTLVVSPGTKAIKISARHLAVLHPLTHSLPKIPIETDSECSVGRISHPEIRDRRVSGIHFNLVTTSDNDVFIEDKSINGTFVNSSRLERNKPRIIEKGDIISLVSDAIYWSELPEERKRTLVGLPAWVLLFRPSAHDVSESASSTDEEEETPEAATQHADSALQQADRDALPGSCAGQNQPSFAAELVKNLTCPICQEMMFCPVSTDCMHHFCALCLATWLERSDNCPECRAFVRRIGRDYMLGKLIQDYLSEHPPEESRRKEIEKMACRVPKVLADFNARASMSQKRRRCDSYSDSDSECSSVSGATSGADVGAEVDSCRECILPGPDGHQCAPGCAQHNQCSVCQRLFPARDLPDRPVSCELCLAKFCDSYWRGADPTGDCCLPIGRGILQKLGDVRLGAAGAPAAAAGATQCGAPPAPGMSPLARRTSSGPAAPIQATDSQWNADVSIYTTSLPVIINAEETRILHEHMVSAGLDANALFQRLLKELDNGTQIYNKVPSHINVKSDMHACWECIKELVKGLFMAYRIAIPIGDLPPAVQRRNACWYGFRCRTQFHNPQHAQRLSHACQATNPNTR